MDSPVRRLADQNLSAVVEALPDRFEMEIELNPENPAELLLTHSPAVIESVDGKPCQYRLPSAYGVVTTGSIADDGTPRVGVDNPRQSAELLIAGAHVAEPDPGDPGIVRINGYPFEKCTVGPGRTDIELE